MNLHIIHGEQDGLCYVDMASVSYGNVLTKLGVLKCSGNGQMENNNSRTVVILLSHINILYYCLFFRSRDRSLRIAFTANALQFVVSMNYIYILHFLREWLISYEKSLKTAENIFEKQRK